MFTTRDEDFRFLIDLIIHYYYLTFVWRCITSVHYLTHIDMRLQFKIKMSCSVYTTRPPASSSGICRVVRLGQTPLIWPGTEQSTRAVLLYQDCMLSVYLYLYHKIYHTVNRLRSLLSLGHLVTWSLGCLVTRSLGHLVTWSLGHLFTL